MKLADEIGEFVDRTCFRLPFPNAKWCDFNDFRYDSPMNGIMNINRSVITDLQVQQNP